uniref:CSON001212 protein n=1 Tax=Culicoides sonorensis TaxID=179676 RepID=A0A336L740_CULSO
MADLEYYWYKLLDITGDSPVSGWIIIPNLISIGLYWIIAGIFFIVDMMPKTKFLIKYKLQSNTNDPLDLDKLPSVIKQVLFNQFCVQIPFSILIHPIVHLRGINSPEIDFVRQVPPMWRITLDFIVFELIREISFYYLHRLFHHPRLYQKYHKMHHEWTSPIAVAAQYCHPLEHLLVNLLPMTIGPFLMCSNVISVAIWYFHSALKTYFDHCGYNFPVFLVYDSTKHDYHHMSFNRCYGILGDNPLILWTIGLNLFTATVYWIGAVFYLILDYIDKPKWLAKYKIMPGVNEPVDMSAVIKTAKVVLFNQFVVGLGISFLVYPSVVFRGGAETIREVPTFRKFVLDIIVSLILNDIFFYYSHRLFHYGWLYKKYHKEHHEWTSPIALAGIYCTPTEHIFCNMISNTIGLVVMRSNLFTTCLWLTHAMLRTLANHSGYKFPFYYDPRSHDYHHLKFNKYFGVLGIMDWLHGTDVENSVKQKWK